MTVNDDYFYFNFRKIYPAKTKVNNEEVSLWVRTLNIYFIKNQLGSCNFLLQIYDKKSVSTDKTGEGETFLEVLRRDVSK